MCAHASDERRDDEPARLVMAAAKSDSLIRACGYFPFALAFLRSAQYFFIRSETAFLAVADIRLVLVSAVAMVRLSARRCGASASSGNVRSIAMISARSCFTMVSAPGPGEFQELISV
jgi:hypothetical protein